MKSHVPSLSAGSSATSSRSGTPEPLLPISGRRASKGSSGLAQGLLRKVLIWGFVSLLMCIIILFSHKTGAVYTNITGHWASPSPSSKPTPTTLEVDVEAGTPQADLESADDGIAEGRPTTPDIMVLVGEKLSEMAGSSQKPDNESAGHSTAKPNDGHDWDLQFAEVLKKTPWLRFPHLDGYFHGLRTLVDKTEHVPEYPNFTDPAPLPPPQKSKKIHKPLVYSPYNSSTVIKRCYLDVDKKIPAPDIFAYQGVPQHMPDPAIGSYSLLGLNDEVCFDRFGRYGPYGMGYPKFQGGTGLAADTENSGNEAIWDKTGKIDWANIDWADAQDRCYAANEHRFMKVDEKKEELIRVPGKMGRTAVVLRAYTGFPWTEHAILSLRAMINELSLKSGGEFVVHILLHVRNNDLPIWSDDMTVQRVLDTTMPREFHDLVTMWSEAEMKLYYPGKFQDAAANPSHEDIHGVYRSAHMPLQIFALQHPEYDHFWNWEMDMRYLGNYYELLTKLGQWADKQPRPLLWERNERYYIPSYHNTWENFTKTVSEDLLHSGRATIFGRLDVEENKKLRFESRGESPMPAECEEFDKTNCGVGESSDLITLNPIFDTDQSGWVFGLDASGYGPNPSRRAAIITASRLSRRLLESMHEEVWRHHHTMFSEMFPSSVAMYHGFKAVYAPHPVYLDRAWSPPSEIDDSFNGGRDHSTSGHGSPYDLLKEHNHRGTSFYYNAEFSGLLWRRWLGYSQMDGRGPYGGLFGQGKRRGGQSEEASDKGSGRMCLRSMLFHPIKWEHPAEEGAA